MNETPDRPGSDDVELYMRTYHSLLRSDSDVQIKTLEQAHAGVGSLLRSDSDVQIKTLEQAHAGVGSLLHPGAQGTKPDMSAFIYSLLCQERNEKSTFSRVKKASD